MAAQVFTRSAESKEKDAAVAVAGGRLKNVGREDGAGYWPLIGCCLPELGGGDTAVSGSCGLLELAGAAGERWILPLRRLGEDCCVCLPRRTILDYITGCCVPRCIRVTILSVFLI